MNTRAPFLDLSSFVQEEVNESQYETETYGSPSSPFLSLYESDNPEDIIDPEIEEYIVFLNELYDEEFDETLHALTQEASMLLESQIANELLDPDTQSYHAERFLQQHFAPLVAQTETMLDGLAREFRQHNSSLTEDEIDTIIDAYEAESNLPPEFDDFFKKIKKAVKKVAKKAGKIAKKGITAAATGGLSLVLPKLKPLIKPLLRRVIQTAIGKLPIAVQPIAKKLAERLPFLKELEEDTHHHEHGETCEVARIQYEFNQQLANLLFAHSEVEQDYELAQVLAQPAQTSYPLLELDQARTKFVDDLSQLREEQDPTPHIEEFIPAILPALRIGIRLAGRKRVVRFLAGLLGKLIRKFVGPKHTPMLSQAIVDAGLRLIQLEADEEDARIAASSAVAATVEETVQRVSDLPDYVLEDQELLEGFVLEAFEQAAAANLPPRLPEALYRQRPSLAQARKLRGAWMMMPRGRHKRYKKFSRKIQSKLSPHKVKDLESFGGIPLEEYLEEELGIAAGETVEATVHLYESIPGTHLTDISHFEVDTPGLHGQPGAQHLHPLTPEAAGLLLGEPDLGRDVDAHYLADSHSTAVGQRFYYLEIPGRKPLTVPTAAGRSSLRRRSQTRLVLDFPKNEIRVYAFLSEIRAQEIAVKLRQRAHIGSLITRLQGLLTQGLNTALTGKSKRTRIIHETITPDQWMASLQTLPAFLPRALLAKLQEWITLNLKDQFKRNPDGFINAANDTADGVTLKITISNPPGFSQLRKVLKGNPLALAGLSLKGSAPQVSLQVVPGYVYE